MDAVIAKLDGAAAAASPAPLALPPAAAAGTPREGAGTHESDAGTPREGAETEDWSEIRVFDFARDKVFLPFEESIRLAEKHLLRIIILGVPGNIYIYVMCR